jgi:WD40 repeat protein
VTLWDLTNPAQPRQLGQFLTDRPNYVHEVAFAPNGNTVATASDGGDGTVTLWDVTDRVQPRQLGPPLTGHTDLVFSVAFAHDGRTLATAEGETVTLWGLTDRGPAPPARSAPQI